MVQTFGTNASNDIYLNSVGNIAVLDALPAIIGACETASKARLGEMVLTQGLGIPNFQAIWIGTPKYATFEAYLRKTLQNVSGVDSLTSLQSNAANNTLSYNAEIKTQYGGAAING